MKVTIPLTITIPPTTTTTITTTITSTSMVLGPDLDRFSIRTVRGRWCWTCLRTKFRGPTGT
jgi:hypothetical protein